VRRPSALSKITETARESPLNRTYITRQRAPAKGSGDQWPDQFHRDLHRGGDGSLGQQPHRDRRHGGERIAGGFQPLHHRGQSEPRLASGAVALSLVAGGATDAAGNVAVAAGAAAVTVNVAGPAAVRRAVWNGLNPSSPGIRRKP